MKVLGKETLEKTSGGGWLDISFIALVEEFVEVDINGNGITGFGCIIC